jgi:glycosyltransferase involved in cell wall biosynthesis
MKKNILMLHGSSDLYGASKIFVTSIEALLECGHNVLVVLSEEGPLSEKIREMGVDVEIIRLGILRRKYFSAAGLVNRVRVLHAAYKALCRLVDDKSITHIYSHTLAVLVGSFAAYKKELPHIWQLLEIIETPKWFFRLMSLIVNRYGGEVIVASNAVRDHWKRHVDSAKLHTVYYGIDRSKISSDESNLRGELGLPADKLIIGMVGRVHYWKGQDYFLRIAGALACEHNNLHFVMIGDAFPGYEYLYDEIGKIIQEENLKNKVTDLGYRTDIYNLIKGFDIFVQPSILPDPFPTVILEAMAVGLPVVATSLGGAKEMVTNGETGYLIDVGQAEESAKSILKLVLSEDDRVKFGLRGKELIDKKFTLSRYKSDYSKFFN